MFYTNKMSLITLACSNYNSEKWIERYLKSVNDQFLPEFSLIIVDANSTDNSLNIIKQYRFRKGISCKIVSCPNRITFYEALNVVTGICDSEYIVSYNTDDHFYPSTLTVIKEYIVRYPSTDIFYSSFGITKDSAHLERIHQIHMPPEHDINVLLHACYIGPFSIVKKKTLLEIGNYNTSFKICGDYELWMRFARAKKTFTRIPEVLGNYFENPIGISTNTNSLNLRLAEESLIRNS